MKKIIIPVSLIYFVLCLNQSTSAQRPNEFVENKGQWDAPFRFKGSVANSSFFLRDNGIRIFIEDPRYYDYIHDLKHGKPTSLTLKDLKFHAYDMEFLGANQKPEFKQLKSAKHYYNYYFGNNPESWKSDIHPCQAVDYLNLYDHINMHLYLDGYGLKYDFEVGVNGRPESIKIKYNGVDSIFISNSELHIKTSVGLTRELKPYAYQYINGEKKEVPCKYKLEGQILSFEFPSGFDRTRPLIIDPTIVFCTFTGSTADNWGFTATYDASGNFYAGGIVVNQVSGTALTGAYPVTTGAIQPTYGGGVAQTNPSIMATDCSFSKFDPTGTTLLYATYFGGSDNEQPHSMIVDYSGNLVIAGRTFSSNFNVTPGCYDNSYNGNGDMFIVKFNPTGTSLLGSTFVGGSGEESVNGDVANAVIGGLKHNYADDARSEVVVDSNNNIFVASCTKSNNFPLVNATQTTPGGNQDAVLIELNSNLTNLLWGTYLGGNQDDAAYVLSFNKKNNAELFVGGGTRSANFLPTTTGLNTTYQGGSTDGFLLKFNKNTKTLLNGTYIGTNQYDQVYGVQTNDSNHVYVVGQTEGAYPVTASVYSNPNSSQFISKLSNNLSSLLASTVFGKGSTATTDISINAFLVDKCENIYVSGWGGPISPGNPGNTTGLPISPNALQTTTDGSDYYFIVLSKNFGSLVYSSFFGQNGGVGEHVDGGTSRFDENGVIYQAICARCGNSGTPAGIVFPTTPQAYSTTNQANNCNLAALKINFELQNPSANASFVGDSIGCAPMTVVFNNTSTSATSYLWDFGNGVTSTAVNPTYTYTAAGNYLVKLIAFNPNGCTFTSDTTTLLIIVKTDSVNASFTVTRVDTCGPFTAIFTNNSTYNNGNPPNTSTFLWDFGDGTTFNGKNPPLHTFPSVGVYTVTLVMIDTNACKSPDTMKAVIDFSASLVKAQFTGPDTICIPESATFVDQSTNPSIWAWTFGDGGTSSVSSPTHTYTTPGTYTVRLITTNPNTCNLIDSAKKIITVYSSPVADFTWSPNPPQPNTPNVFTNLSTGATKYYWDFGDGTSSTLKDDIHIYEKDGIYTVCLTVWNDFGCKDTACRPVRGMVIPLVDVPSGFSPNGDGINDMVFVKGYGIKNMTFRIFNRWGEKVFETKEKSKGWDGRYKGVMQEMEVYGYTLYVEFMDGTKTTKKGNITLLK